MNRRDDMNYENENDKGFLSGFRKGMKKLLVGDGLEADFDEESEELDDRPYNSAVEFPDPETINRTKDKERVTKPAIEGSTNIVNFRNHYSGTQTEMVLSQPKDMDGAASVCGDVNNNKACIVNLEGLENEMAQRIADFVSGAVFSVGGDIQRVSNVIFIAAPASVHISNEVKNELKKSSRRFFNFSASPV